MSGARPTVVTVEPSLARGFLEALVSWERHLLGAPASWERGLPAREDNRHPPPRRGLEARDPGKPAIHPSRETGRAPARPTAHRMPRRAEAPPRQAFLYSDQKSFHSSRLCCFGVSR